METSSLANLERLSDTGLRGGVDMRPTLLRVLTDLYVQKLAHTPDEERHYTELALRLLDSVDVQTRAAVAARLTVHVSAPRPVIDRLAADLPEVTAALQTKRLARAYGGGTAAQKDRPAGVLAHAAPPTGMRAQAEIDEDIACELNDLFFAADANERRLILLNIDIVVGATAARPTIARDGAVGRRLEAAALARKREDFTNELSRSLRIPREQSRRIASDKLGEPIVVAAKALGIPRDLLYRILLFVNNAVGHSVERVHALATLYDEISLNAALDLVAVWQALNVNRNARGAGLQWRATNESTIGERTVSERTLARPIGRIPPARELAQKTARRDAS
jgi:hypothetical protein